MKTGEYKVKFNYTILRGFIDAFGLVMALLIYQTTYAYYDKFIHPDQVINNVYPNGVPLDRWILGGIVPFIALAVLVFSVVYMFIPHKSRTLMITADNAQKYYDNLKQSAENTCAYGTVGLHLYFAEQPAVCGGVVVQSSDSA